MSDRARIILALFIMGVSITMMVVGVRHWRTLWDGVKTKEVIKEVTIVKEAPRVGPGAGPGQFYAGPLTIEHGYVTKDNNVPSGDYQVLDQNGTIWMLKLCQAKDNGVLPSFPIGRVVDILYTKGENCYDFVSAQMIKQEGSINPDGSGK